MQTAKQQITIEPQLVIVDLAPFSLSRHTLWPHPVAICIGGIAVLAAIVTGVYVGWEQAGRILYRFGHWFFGLICIVALVQITSRSSVGRVYPCVHPSDINKRPQGFDRSLGDLVAETASFRVASNASTRADPNRAWRYAKSALYSLLGLALVAVAVVCVVGGIQPNYGPWLGFVGVVMIVPILVVFAMARRALQPDAEWVLANDLRAPILFLRSVDDDRLKVQQHVRLLGIPDLHPLPFEKALSSAMSSFGPLVAVGEPGEHLPQPGAVLVHLGENHWQETVVSLIRSSRLILMMAGTTSWVVWEMQNIVREKKLQHLLLLLPPGTVGSSNEDRQRKWWNAVRAFRILPSTLSSRN